MAQRHFMRPATVFLLVLAALVEAGLLTLANWQYGRYNQRLAENAEFATRPTHTLTGTFLNQNTAALENQPNPTNPEVVGWRILTPLQTSASVVLVDRGWAVPIFSAPNTPDFSSFTTSATSVAVIAAPVPARKGWLKGPDTTVHPRLLAYLKPALISSETTAATYQLATTATDGIAVPLPPPLANPQRHLSYALQWLGMAIAFIVLCVSAWLKSRRSRRRAA